MSWRTNPNPTVKPPFGSYIDWSHPLAKGLVLCLIFNEAEGTFINDLSLYRNNGTLYGPTWGDGLIFDGSNDYGLIPSNIDLRPTKDFAIEAIARFDNFSDYRTVVTHDDNGGGDDSYILRVNNDGTALFAALNSNGWNAQNIVSAQVLTAGTKYHLIGAYDDNYNLRIYINGTEDANSPKAASDDVVYEVLTNVNIGKRGGTASPNTLFMDGSLDKVSIYKRTPLASEIEWLHAEPYCFIAWPSHRVIFDFGAAGQAQESNAVFFGCNF